MGKKNYYAVKAGIRTGLFDNWTECQAAVKGYPGAEYRGFVTKAEALVWLKGSEGSRTDLGEPAESAGSATGSGIAENMAANSVFFDYEVYTDGSFQDGRYSYGYVFIRDGEVVYESNGVGEDREAAEMRNVAGELTAVMRAVKKAEALQARILIHHDYSGIAHWVTGEWKTANKFTQAYVVFMRNRRRFFEFQKVAGHSGDKFNDYADRLAKEALGIRETQTDT